MYGIRLIRIGNHLIVPPEWLTGMDPEMCRMDQNGCPTYPTGLIDSSRDPSEAMTFETAADAVAFYNTQSKTVPYRPDGAPNCPLTAFTVEVVEVTE
jgi:hypothetical protein